MKRFYSIFVFLTISFFIFSQTSPPLSISYQGIARNASGDIIPNQLIGLNFIIHQGSASGTSVFNEAHSVTTNSLGLFSLSIGAVNPTSFQTIDWSNGPYFLEVQMDPSGSTSYISVGAQQLISVPYALYAKNSYSAASSYSASYAVGSYTTMNAPPISITTNTSATSTTLNVTQGSNTSSVTIDFPAQAPSSVTMTAIGIVSVNPASGNAFTVSTNPPSFTSTDGITNISGTYPNYSVTTTPTLNFNNTTSALSISGGNTVTIPSSTFNAGSGVSITGNTITNTAPDQTVTISNGLNTNINGTYPNFTVNATPSLSILGNTVSISNGNSITIPASPTPSITGSGITAVTPTTGATFTINTPAPAFTNGAGINVSGTYPNYTVVNTAPNQTVSIASGTNVIIGGTYPNYTISSTPTLALAGNVISISGGNSITLPPPASPTITGVGLVVVTPTAGNSFTVNVPSQTLSITGNGGATSYSLNSTQGGTVALPSPTISVNTPHSLTSSVGGYSKTLTVVAPTLLPASGSSTNIASITSNTTSLQYTVNVPAPALGITTNTATGTSTLTITQGAGSSTVNIPGATGTAWGLLGNIGTNPALNFIGTTDSSSVIFKTNSFQRMRITGSGSISIGGITPEAFTHIQAPNMANADVLKLGNANQPNWEWAWSIDGTSKMTLNNEGNGSPINVMAFDNNTGFVGIGTITPFSKLHIKGTGLWSSFISMEHLTEWGMGVNNNDFMLVKKTGTTFTPIIFFATGGADFLNTSGNPIVRILNNGNVGIGTVGPLSILDITSANSLGYDINILNTTSSGPGIRFSAQNKNWAIYASNPSSGAGDQKLVFRDFSSAIDRMVIDQNGAVGIGIVTPAAGTKLHVNGPTMISDGTQGNGKIFVSDASGMGSWKQGSYITTFALNTGQSMVNISITPTQFATVLGTFTKNEVNTNIEVILNTHIVVGDLVGANGVTFELRIDGNAFPNNMGRVIYWQDNNGTYGLNTYINVNINAIWTAGIPIGAHQITLWVYANGGSATNAYYNPGNYNNTSLIIKETR